MARVFIRVGGFLVGLAVWLAPGSLRPALAQAQEITTSDVNKLKAAFLYQFASYVRWPSTNTIQPERPWSIGVLGEDPLGELLHRTVAGRLAQYRPVAVSPPLTMAGVLAMHTLYVPAPQGGISGALKLDGATGCDIVFITLREAEDRRRALQKLRGRPVLTVGESPEFLAEGGMVQFRLQRDRLVMDLNVDEATRSGLQISAKLVGLAREVILNGERRRNRR